MNIMNFCISMQEDFDKFVKKAKNKPLNKAVHSNNRQIYTSYVPMTLAVAKI